MKVGRLTEAALVEAIRRDFGGRGRGLELGIGDDAAVLRSGRRKRERLLLTTDLLVEDVDFRQSFHPPFLLGRKSLNVNLSDIAAMGGRPRWALLGLALPRRLGTAWVEDFFRGFRSACRDEDVRLIGGDLSAADKIAVSVTVVGEAHSVVTRRGARPGDFLFVSGPLGDAAAGLRLLEKGARPQSPKRVFTDSTGSGLKRVPQISAGIGLKPGKGARRAVEHLLQAFLDPKPKTALGLELARRHLASAMIDLSDGLSVDLRHICQESRVGAEVWGDCLPLSREVKELFPSPVPLALHGGEDFELLFSAPRRRLKALRRLGRSHPLFPIGRIVRGEAIVLIERGGRRSPLPSRGWQHF